MYSPHYVCITSVFIHGNSRVIRGTRDQTPVHATPVTSYDKMKWLLNPWLKEDIGSFRGELLERLQEKREGLWKKWETEVSKLEGGWRPWRWWPGRPYARSVGLGAHCPAHRRLGLSKAVRSRWAGYLNTTDSQHWQHCSGVSHNWIFLDPIGSLASSVYIISNVQCVMCNM